MRVADDKPVYNISVAADLVGVHPRTLRIYEEAGLVHPTRTPGNTRRYSQADIERLLHVRRLIEEIGVNIAGVRVILRIEERIGVSVEEWLED
ncbi:MAG: MerR family transcriptional regulator [Clostridia bacterium]|nr:MAG: MerR family transcriptional regulator [Clostridia bacterium]